MPEVTFRDLCDRLKESCPGMSHSKAKRVVGIYLTRPSYARSVAELLELGYYLMHSDPTGEEAIHND